MDKDGHKPGNVILPEGQENESDAEPTKQKESLGVATVDDSSANNEPDAVGQDSSENNLVDTEKDESDETAVDAGEGNEDEQAVVAGVAAIGGVAIWIHKIKKLLKLIWATPKYRYSVLGGLILIIGTVFAIPATRYGTFNLVGIRASAEVFVLDQDTGQPLKSVSVSLDGSQGQTNQDGYVKLYSVRLGTGELTVEKTAYAVAVEEVTINLGSNSLSDVALTPTGTRYSFKVIHWLNGQPIEDVEAIHDESSAFSDGDGSIILTVAPSEEKVIKVRLVAENFIEQTVELSAQIDEAVNVKMVNSDKHHFISNRDGVHSVYETNLDGSEQHVVFAGSGKEQNDLYFSVQPANSFAALVSTKDGARNDEGVLLGGLFIINLKDNSSKLIDESESLRLVGWSGDYLVYMKRAAGESGYSPTRSRLIGYNAATQKSIELEASNYFKSAMIARGGVYYAPDDSFKQSNPKPHFFVVKPNGSGKRTLIAEDVSWMTRIDYDTFIVQARRADFSSEWYEYKIGGDSSRKLDAPPSNTSNRPIAENADAGRLAWVEVRDGKGSLIVEDTKTHEEKVLFQASGLKQPLRWINKDLIVFRVANDGIADYVISTSGGEPMKVSDVSDVLEAPSYYYY